MDDEQFHYTTRLDAAKLVAGRFRAILFTNLLAFCIVALGSYNASYSWLRYFVLINHWPGPALTETNRILQEKLITEWLDTQVLSVPLIGLKVAWTDVPLPGSIVLMVLSAISLQSARQQNGVFVSFLRETTTKSVEVRRGIYHALAAALLFAPGRYRSQAIGAQHRRGLDQKRRLPSPLLLFMIFAPPFAILAMVVTDFLQVMVLNSPFRLGHEVLWQHMWWSEKRQFLLLEVGPVSMTLLSLYFCSRAKRCVVATMSALQRYAELPQDSPLISEVE